MSGNDWLYDVGVNTQTAGSAIDAFIADTTTKIDGIKKITFSVDVTASKANIQSFVTDANKSLAQLQAVNVSFNFRGATRSLNTFIANFERNSGALDTFKAKLAEVDAAISAHDGKLSQQAQFFNQVTAATRAKNAELDKEVRLQNQDAASAAANTRAHETLTGSYTRAAGGARSHADAMDFLQRVAGNTVFKFIEYEVVMQAFNATVHEFTDSINEASNVQFEQTLQRLYNGTLDTNRALTDAIIIAKRWGSDITDVQQVIGLWTKNVNDLRAATYLADQAEQMHRASGIETTEVYRMSMAIASQYGLALKDLPKVYDQVAEASLRMALPMKNLTGKGGQMEGMKALVEGLAESGATLKSLGFDTAGALAVVSNQITATGEAGGTAARNLSSMFAALEGRGTGRKNFEAIIGTDIKNTDDLLQRMQTHVKELYQAYSNGDLGVKPQQYESLATFEGSLKRIAQLRNDLLTNSNMKLQLISESEVATFTGQVDRLKASVQAMSLAYGKQLLPGASEFARVMSGSVIPTLEHAAPALAHVTVLAVEMGAAFLALAAMKKVSAYFTELATAESVARTMSESYGLTIGRTAAETARLTATMEREQAVIARLSQAYEVLNYSMLTTEEKLKGTKIAATEFDAVMTQTQGINSYAGAIKNIGMQAARTAGPLIALMALMQMLEGLDKRNAAVAGIEDDNLKYQTPLQRLKGVLPGMQRGLVESGAILSGHGGDLDVMKNLRDQMLHEKHAPRGSNAYFVQMQQDTINRALRKGDHDAAARAAADQQKFIEAQYDLHHDDTAEAARRQFEKSAAVQTPITQGAGEAPPYNKADKKKAKGPTEQQGFSESINDAKRQSSASITHWNDEAEAAKNDIDVQKQLIQTYGISEGAADALSAAYNREVYAVGMQAQRTKEEIDVLKQRIAHGHELIAQHPQNAAANAQEAKAISMAEAAIKKASGAYDQLIGKMKLLQAERDKATRENNYALDLGDLGNDPTFRRNARVISNRWGSFSGGDDPRTMSEFKSRASQIVADAKRAKGAVDEMNAAIYAQGQIDRIGQLATDFYKKNADRWTKAERDEFIAWLGSLQSDYRDLGNTVAQSRDKIQSINEAIYDTIATINSKNIASLGSILGVDRPEVTFVEDMLKGYKSIHDEIEKISKLEHEYSQTKSGITEQQQKGLDVLRAQVQEEAALLPILERAKQIRASSYYKATENVLNKTGAAMFDKSIDEMFKVGATSSGLKSMMADWTKQVVGAWWQQTAKSITDKLFGIKDHDAQLKRMYDDNAANLKLIADQEKDAVDSFGTDVTGYSTAVQMFRDYVLTFKSVAEALQQAGQRPAPGSTIDPNTLTPLDALAAISSNTGQTAANTATSADVARASAQSAAAPAGSSAAATGGLAILGALGIHLPPGINGSSFAHGLNGLFGKGGTFSGLNDKGNGNFGAQLSGAMLAYAGYQQGGISGGIESGLGAYQATGNPYIAAAVALFSAFSHHDNPALMPDKYAPGFGQGMANFAGSGENGAPGYTANGVTYTADYTEWQQHGNRDEGQYIADWIMQNQSTAQKLLTPEELQLFTGTHGGVTYLKNGQVQLDNGQTIGGTTLLADAKDALDKIAQNTGATNGLLAPLISITATGTGPNYSPSVYNTPGLNSDEFSALQANRFPNANQNIGSYVTPGVGANALAPMVTPPVNATRGRGFRIKLTSQVQLDGQTVARIVNAINSDRLNRQLPAA